MLIVSELSRIGRDAARTPFYIAHIEDAGVEIWGYLSDERIGLDNESSELNTIFKGLATSFERRRARERTYDALKGKAERGFVAGGKLYGYDNLRTPGGVTRVVNEAQADVVRRIFRLYADGVSLGSIAQTLNADGVPGPRASWKPSRHRNGTWSLTALRETLRNETYRGVVIWNRTQKVTRGGRVKVRKLRPQSDWKRREQPELRIVPEELWSRVQQRIAQNGETYARGTGGRLIARPARSDYDSRPVPNPGRRILAPATRLRGNRS